MRTASVMSFSQHSSAGSMLGSSIANERGGSEETEEKEEGSQTRSNVNPLLERLNKKYTQQRNKQLNEVKKGVEKDQAEIADRNNALNPSLELLSDYTIMMMNELEMLCANHGLERGVELINEIRSVTNNEIRQALSAIEDGYTSAFHSLQRQAAYKMNQERRASRGERPSSSALLEKSNADEGVLKECPPDWKANVKNEVASEMKFQASIQRLPKIPKPAVAKQFSLKESCSVVPAFFAESLASLLLCEVVRVYLYDENQNLHCCSTYPYQALQGDPMHATYTEIMLARDLHTTICNQRIAVNGSESVYTLLTKRDIRVVKSELQASGWGSMRSCLIFPIVPLSSSKSLGLIHAVNKVPPSSKEPGKFTPNDEVLMSMACRLLGCILTKYPLANFTLRVGEMFHKAAFPHEKTTNIDDHIPERVTDLVVDAAETGNRAVATPVPIMMFRAPLCDVYVSKHHRARARKMGKLIEQDSTLSSVEFNISSVNELWQTGMEENVLMHQEYRKLQNSMNTTKLLVRNILDGLAAARTMRDAAEIARYLQTLELFGRSESLDMLSEFISDTLIGSGNGPAPIQERSCSEQTVSVTERSESKGVAGSEDDSKSPFIGTEEAEDLLYRHKLLNQPATSRIHNDGPDCIRSYSCDPKQKRAQVQAIDKMITEGELRKKQRSISTAENQPAYLHSTASIKAKATEKVSTDARYARTHIGPPRPPNRPFLLDTSK